MNNDLECRCCAGHTAHRTRKYISSSGNVQRHSSVMKNNVDLRQNIHLDNPYNREKLRGTLCPFQSTPNLQQRNPYSREPKRTLHGDFKTKTVNSSSHGQKLVLSCIAGEAHIKDGKMMHNGKCCTFSITKIYSEIFHSVKKNYLHTTVCVYNSPPKNLEIPSLTSITECTENVQEHVYVTERAYQSAVC